MQKATKIIEEQIKARGGTFKIVTQPQRIGHHRDIEDLAEKYGGKDSDSEDGEDSDNMGDLDGDDGIIVDDDGEEEKKGN